MNRPLISSIISFSLTIAAFARIGETQQELSARYGEGQKSDSKLKVPGAETYKYEKAGFRIGVVFLDGKSISEVFERKDRKITDDDIKTILKLYDTPSTSWRFDRRENRWERSGKPKLAGFRLPGHDDFFCIRDIAAWDAAEKGTADAKGL
jgi:hypothetical protein